MQFNNYAFIAPQPGLEGTGFVLMTKAPYCIGKIVQFKTEEKYEAFLKHTHETIGRVTGYRICILYAGTLNDLTPGIDDLKLRKIMLDEMADWFFENRIKKMEGGFLRYMDSKAI